MAPDTGTPRPCSPQTPESWMVVNRPGRSTVAQCRPAGRPGGTRSPSRAFESALARLNVTVSPGAKRAGGVFPESNTGSRARPTICQPPGVDEGYTPVCLPAIPTEPAGTCRRGDARRGDAIDGSTSPR